MKRTIEKIVAYAQAIAEPDKIILFGSVANGMANVYSDIDLLIIVDYYLPNEENIIERLTSFAQEISLKIDILIRTNEQINEEMEKADSFVKSIMEQGKKMYEKR